MSDILKDSGRIDGDVVGLLPCLWIGVSLTRDKFILWHPGAKMDTSNEMDSPSGKPGQFVLQHQHSGLATSQVTLCGAVLPLASCEDPQLTARLLAIAEKYVGPFSSTWPNLRELVAVRDDLLAVGPLEPIERFRDLAEAYLTFDLTAATYEWLAARFRMATRVVDNDDYQPVHVQETSFLPRDLPQFLEWMSGPGGLCSESWVHGAFLYENSD